jgi:hypothetical protein
LNHAHLRSRVTAFNRTSMLAAARRSSNHTTATHRSGGFARVNAPPRPAQWAAKRASGRGLMPM